MERVIQASRSWRLPGLLAALAVGLVALVIGWVAPGPLSIDEVTYHRMTHDLVGGHGVFIDNGYEELRSSALESLFIRATADGKLAAQYPYGGPVLAAPFYVAFGAAGPFLLQSLGFVLALALTYRIARQLLRERGTAIAASGLLAITYFAEYALASWPHASALAAVLGAFSLAISAWQTAGDRRALRYALAAGFVTGLGTAVRLDVLFCVPALAAPFFFSSPTRVRELVALAVGMIPTLAAIAWTNYIRWGTASPISYGPNAHGFGYYIAFGIVGVAVVTVAWLVTRPVTLRWFRTVKRSTLWVVLSVAVVLLLVRMLVPGASVGLIRAVHGLIAITVDLRERPGRFIILDQSQAIIYHGAFKKALLQSVPFLVVAALAIVQAKRQRELRFPTAWLLAIPTTYIGFFGAFAWDGGVGLNMRYLLPALPFLCCLVAQGAKEWLRVGSVQSKRLAFALMTTVPVLLWFLVPEADMRLREQIVLTFPLVIVVALVVALVAWVRRSGRAAATACLVLTGAAIGWSVAITVLDARWSKKRRTYNHEVAECVAPHVTDDALLLIDVPDAFYGIIDEKPHIRFARPQANNFGDAARIIHSELDRGHRVFGAILHSTWLQLLEHGALRGTAVDRVEITGPFIVAEIRRARPGEPAEPSEDIGLPDFATCGPDNPLTIWQLFDPPPLRRP
jgi:hypothetical protein